MARAWEASDGEMKKYPRIEYMPNMKPDMKATMLVERTTVVGVRKIVGGLSAILSNRVRSRLAVCLWSS